MKSTFTLFRRKSAKVWYFYYTVNGRRVSRSTGCSRKGDAELVATRFLKENADVVGKHPPNESLGMFATGFFDSDSAYMKRQAEKGRLPGEATQRQRRHHLQHYILEKWKDTPLKDLDAPAIEDWLGGLQLSNQTKNHLIQVFQVVLKEAVRAHLLESVPPLERFKTSPKRADVFSREELKALFPENLLSIWPGIKEAALMMTLASTGIRPSEARALLWEDYLQEGAFFIRRALRDYEDGEFRPKNAEVRVVWIPARTRTVLDEWHGETITGDQQDLIFWGFPGKPYCRRTLNKLFDDGLKKAGIGKNGYQLYSLRRGYNTRMRGELKADATLRLLMGHKSETMTGVYDSPDAQQYLQRIEGAKKVCESFW